MIGTVLGPFTILEEPGALGAKLHEAKVGSANVESKRHSG